MPPRRSSTCASSPIAVSRGASLEGVSADTPIFDLSSLKLSPGEGRRLQVRTAIAALELGGERYRAEPRTVPVTIDVSRMSGGGYALKLALRARVCGPCMRCLKDAAPELDVQAREVSVPGEDEQMSSPYVHDEQLDVAGWAHDAFALAVPAQILCKTDCLGLCPQCAADLNEAGPDHAHARAPDSRWAKLGELRFE
jgi:uncharacterized protein